jgi:hypothetical protein
VPAAGPLKGNAALRHGRPAAKRAAWQIGIGDDPDRAAAYPVLADADRLLVEAVERAWLGATEIEVTYDCHATRSSLRRTPLSGRARSHRRLLSERQADECGAYPEPAFEPALLILLDGLLRTYLPGG